MSLLRWWPIKRWGSTHLSTHPVNTPPQHTLSTHPINTPCQHTSHPTLSTHPINTSCHHNLATLPPPPPSLYHQALAGAMFFNSSRVLVERLTPLIPLGALPGVLEFTMNVTFTLTVTCDPTLKTYCMTPNDVTNAVYSLSQGVSFTYPRALQVRPR